MTTTPKAEIEALPPLSREEFIGRFIDHMLGCCGEKFDDGSSIREYAEQAAPAYWEDSNQRDDGPEECADTDMSYWGES